MPSAFITKRSVDAAQAGDRQTVLWDTDVKGFGLLVLPSGTKSYVFQYRVGGRGARLRRYTIGRHGSPWTPDSARRRAKELAEKVRTGIDPIDAERDAQAAQAAAEEERRRIREMAFADYADLWLKSGLRAGTRQRTREGYRAALAKHVTPVLDRQPLPEIGRRDVAKVIDRIPAGQPAVRRITFAVLRMLFNWAKSRGDIDASPLEGMDPPSPAASRDRVLTDEELALVLRAAARLERPFGQFYQMIFATGQRRNEVAGLAWGELDREGGTWSLPGSRAKNGEPNIVPLNRQAIAVLDALAGRDEENERKWPRKGLVFPATRRRSPAGLPKSEPSISGFSRAKTRLDTEILALARQDAEAAGEDPEGVTIEPWRLHDARRTLATALQRLGVRFEVTEAVLNHTSGTSRSGVAAVYQRHDWAEEKRAALEAWGDHCDRIISGREAGGNVVPLRAANSSPGDRAR